MNEDKTHMQSECAFMKLPKCMLQDVSKRLDLQICMACIAGRSERHLYDIKDIIGKIASAEGIKINGR